MKTARRYGYPLLFGGGVLLLDQLTKWWVHNNLRLYETRAVVEGCFNIHYVRNTGAAFGFLGNSLPEFRIPFFIGISLLAVGIIFYLFHKIEDSEFLVPFSLSLILGGAMGNLVDRIRLGEVIDFLLVYYKSFRWPAFNVADIAITVGVILLIFRMFFFKEPQEDTAPT